jgi:hypothetical protein
LDAENELPEIAQQLRPIHVGALINISKGVV